jgi:hypothetical protein
METVDRPKACKIKVHGLEWNENLSADQESLKKPFALVFISLLTLQVNCHC